MGLEIEWKRNVDKGKSLNIDMELRSILVCLETFMPLGVAREGKGKAGEIGRGQITRGLVCRGRKELRLYSQASSSQGTGQACRDGRRDLCLWIAHSVEDHPGLGGPCLYGSWL